MLKSAHIIGNDSFKRRENASCNIAAKTDNAVTNFSMSSSVIRSCHTSLSLIHTCRKNRG